MTRANAKKQSLVSKELEYQIEHYKDGLNPSQDVHYHDYYEITFYLGREQLIYLSNYEQYQVRYGDIVFCNMFEPHLWKCRENQQHERVTIGIHSRDLFHYSSKDANFLELFLFGRKNYPIYHADSWVMNKYISLIMYLRENELPHARGALVKGVFQMMLAYLYEDCYERVFAQPLKMNQMEVVSHIIQYIDQNIGARISLEALSKEVNYSESYISRVFRKITGLTITNYIADKRLMHAVDHLKGKESITGAAEKAGFDNYSYFYKLFKQKMGMSPNEYRRMLFEK